MPNFMISSQSAHYIDLFHRLKVGDREFEPRFKFKNVSSLLTHKYLMLWIASVTEK